MIKKISPYFTGAVLLLLVIAFLVTRQNILWPALLGLCLLIAFNAGTERIGAKKGMISTKRHMLKLVFAELLSFLIIGAVTGFRELNTLNILSLLSIFLYGTAWLADDFNKLKNLPEEEIRQKKADGLGLTKIIRGFTILTGILIAASIVLLLFPPSPKAPYSWAAQINSLEEIAELDHAVVLFGKQSCPSCLEAESFLRGMSRQSRDALYYCDTDMFRDHASFQETLEKYQVEAVPSLCVIAGGSLEGTFSLAGEGTSLYESAINEAYTRYFRSITDS